MSVILLYCFEESVNLFLRAVELLGLGVLYGSILVVDIAVVVVVHNVQARRASPPTVDSVRTPNELFP